MMQYLMEHKDIILGGLFALSELIGLIPGIKASGVFQSIYNGLKSLKERFGSPSA